MTRLIVSTLVPCAMLFLPALARTQSEPPVTANDLEAYCRNAPCRENMVVRVRLADGRVQEETAPLYRPAVTRQSVSVLLGEEIRAVPEFDDETFLGWREARRRESSRNLVLTFKLAQMHSDGSLSAAISNSGDDPVKLRLYIRTPGSAEGEYTSSCPVVAGGTVYEYWSRPVAEVIIREASLLTEDSALMCD